MTEEELNKVLDHLYYASIPLMSKDEIHEFVDWVRQLKVEIGFLQQANTTNLQKILNYETEKDSLVEQQSRLWAMYKDQRSQSERLRSALENLLGHVQMIGLAEGFPIEVTLDPDPDPQYPSAFNIKAALIEAAAALGRDDQELRSYFPEMFAENTEPIEKIE